PLPRATPRASAPSSPSVPHVPRDLAGEPGSASLQAKAAGHPPAHDNLGSAPPASSRGSSGRSSPDRVARGRCASTVALAPGSCAISSGPAANLKKASDLSATRKTCIRGCIDHWPLLICPLPALVPCTLGYPSAGHPG